MFKVPIKAIAIALTVMFLISCDQKEAQREPVPVSQVGTSDQGGGGDVPAEQQLSAAEITKMINAVQWELRPALYRAELGLESSSEVALIFFKDQKHPDPLRASQALLEVLPKLYSSPISRLYSALEKVQFVAKTDGPCLDLHAQSKDGSAFNSDPHEICLSVPRLQSRLTAHVAWSEILSLAAHELAHQAGANEEQAQAFQFLIKHQSGLTTSQGYRAQAWHLGFIGKFRWHFEQREQVFEKADPESISQLCADIGRNHESLESTFERKVSDINAVGLLFERPHTLRILKAATMQSEYLTGFCDDTDYDISEESMADRNLDARNPFPFSASTEIPSKNSFLIPSAAEGNLQIVRKHDWKAALALYLQIKENIRRYEDFVAHPEKSPPP